MSRVFAMAMSKPFVETLIWTDLYDHDGSILPSGGLVSRSGVYAGWPTVTASLGPMTRNVRDQALMLDALVGYDAEDPMTGLGVGEAAPTYIDYLDADGLKGARVGILRSR